jgi:prevent-host-death family protein
MKQVGIKQARQGLPALIDQVETGEGIIITRQGKAVAQLVPVLSKQKALPSLVEFRRTKSRGTSAARLLREDRDAR